MDTQGYKALGLGNTGMFWDGSEQYWEPTIKAIDSVWNTYDTIPVNRDKYLPLDVNLIAEDNRSRYQSNDPKYHTEGDQYFNTFGFENSVDENGNIPTPNNVASSTAGIYRSPRGVQLLHNYQGLVDKGIFNSPEEAAMFRPDLDDKLDRRTLGLTDGGVRAMQVIDDEGDVRPFSSVGMHELGGHYYDDAIAGDGRMTASAIMQSYGQDLSREEYIEKWMNDPRTNHLNLHDASNTGLRTLLRNRSHHGGVVNPQEGFGEYYASALSEPHYNSIWSNPGVSEKEQKYKKSFSEKIARRVGENMRPQHQSEKFGIFENGSNKKFADSLATFLNSR